ncbi:CoA pyrophosphatase [Sphingomonas floccifaciens]|uniref:CoA pyrophosphatase n=1 Tax=Sphingomonas floccifaciens TaxID=1844115 RepID=A0ABW4NFT4_9SPHN
MTLAERLRAALDAGAAGTPELLTGDLHALELEGAPPATEAAVLVAITDRAEPGVILTRRTETLRAHAGQVAFPGGRIDPEDADAVAAALREAREEIGLPSDAVTIVGTVSPYRTGTGYRVTPVIATVPPDLPLTPSEAEVAAVFEAPLAYVLDPANHRAETAMWKERERHYTRIDWQGETIWGATAAMLVNLSKQLKW